MIRSLDRKWILFGEKTLFSFIFRYLRIYSDVHVYIETRQIFKLSPNGTHEPPSAPQGNHATLSSHQIGSRNTSADHSRVESMKDVDIFTRSG